MSSNTLSFGKGNAKISGKVLTFSLPSGWSCPGACACLARADRETGKLQAVRKPSHPDQEEFRCYSASQECYSTEARKMRWRNMDALTAASKIGLDAMVELIDNSLLPGDMVRVHASGDFFSQMYFDAWMEVARRNPQVQFYAYTKSLNFWAARIESIPPNFALTASKGGRFDALIEEFELRYCQVVFHPDDAERLGLEIDHDDTHAMRNGPSFALLLHGGQPKGSAAAAAQSRMRAEQIQFSYTDKKPAGV